jgi:CelD/BcsL family acetyltransferase involved in cellulose biosynthesis
MLSPAIPIDTNSAVLQADLVKPREAVSSVDHGLVYCIQPLEDARWEQFLEGHPRASVFHSSQWLKALQQTYGYQPVAYTTSSAAQKLEDAIVFCKVDSWLTGRRLVSLPFSDHCDPLAEADDVAAITRGILQQELGANRWRYVELRPLQPLAICTQLHRTDVTYAFHQLDLKPDLDTLFRNLHKNSTQRKILRAEREGLIYREGTTDEFLDHFYRLFQMTRQRHNVPPQPKEWFANLIACFGDALKIRVAFAGDRSVAAMITIRFKETLVYKYGCSDPRFNKLGSMHLLFWRAIQEAKMQGLESFDFGRTDAGQQGLITFKNRWGAKESALTYSRYGAEKSSTHFFDLPTTKWKAKATKYVLSCLPSGIVSTVGRVLYRHIG